MKKENMDLAHETMDSLQKVLYMTEVTVHIKGAHRLFRSPFVDGYHFDSSMHPELFEHIKTTLIEALEQDLKDLGVEV